MSDENKEVFPLPPEMHMCGTTTATASLVLYPDTWDMTEEDLSELREAGKRFCFLAEERMVAKSPFHDELIPVLVMGSLNEVKDNYLAKAEKVKTRFEWWIHLVSVRVVTPDRKVATAHGHPLPEISRKDVLTALLEIGAKVVAEYPKLVCREFTPNNDKMITYNSQLDWMEKLLCEQLAVATTPLLFLQQDHTPEDVFLAMRWPTEGDVPTPLNWMIRKIAQVYTGRKDPMVWPKMTFEAAYIPPNSANPIGERVTLYSGKEFLETGKEEALEDGAALRAPASAFE